VGLKGGCSLRMGRAVIKGKGECKLRRGNE
jgi:hypothetical protein